VYKIYAESFRGTADLRAVQGEAQALIARAAGLPSR
jgi:phosphoglucomutase